MANSIEGRVPFLDHRLIEFMNGIPLEMKIKMCSNFSLVTKILPAMNLVKDLMKLNIY